MKYIIYIVTIVSSISCLPRDKLEELTPKTATVTISLLIPTETILTAEDYAEVQARWDEHNEAINQ